MQARAEQKGRATRSPIFIHLDGAESLDAEGKPRRRLPLCPRKCQSRNPSVPALEKENAFDHDVRAWRGGKRVALSNFVLSPLPKYGKRPSVGKEENL